MWTLYILRTMEDGSIREVYLQEFLTRKQAEQETKVNWGLVAGEYVIRLVD